MPSSPSAFGDPLPTMAARVWRRLLRTSNHQPADPPEAPAVDEDALFLPTTTLPYIHASLIFPLGSTTTPAPTPQDQNDPMFYHPYSFASPTDTTIVFSDDDEDGGAWQSPSYDSSSCDSFHDDDDDDTAAANILFCAPFNRQDEDEPQQHCSRPPSELSLRECDANNPDHPHIPESFRCPISRACMRDPVVDLDGYSYERRNIVRWLKRHSSSPMTRRNGMTIAELRPNRALSNAIEEAKLSSDVTRTTQALRHHKAVQTTATSHDIRLDPLLSFADDYEKSASVLSSESVSYA